MVEKEAYKKIFEEFDEKKHGYLRRQETADAIRCCGLNPSDAQIRQAIKGLGTA